MESKINAKLILAWLLSLGAPIAIYFIPTSDSFTGQMRTFLMVTVMAILMIAFENVPRSAVTFLLPVSYIILGLADSSLAWFAWTMSTLWMVIGALLLVNVLDSSGILKRVSYRIILMTGGTYRGLILGLGVLGIILNVVLFNNGFVILAGLAYGLCSALELEKFSKEGTGIFLAAAIAGIIPGAFCYGTNIIMIEGYWASVVGNDKIGWLDFTFFNLPLIVYYILALILIMFMFKSDKTINSKEYVTDQLNKLGPMTFKEKKAAIWIVLMLGYVIVCGIKGWDSTWAFIVTPALMLLPAIGCGSEEDVRRLDFSFILFVASCMSIGFVAAGLGFGQFISEATAPITQNATPTVLTMAIYFINVILNFLLTPMAIMAGFTSTYAQIAVDAGLNPYVIYAIESLGLDQILFPYEYALYMLYFSFGFIKMKDFIKYFGAKMILCSIVLFVVCIPFWKITGLFLA